MLRLEKVSKNYGYKQIVTEVSLEIKPGDITGLIGPNGAGKTTLLNMITGLLKPNSGNIYFESINQQESKESFLKNIAYIPDSLYLYDNLTGREYVTFISRLWKVERRQAHKEIENLAKIFYIDHKLDNFIRTYSKGMKQKISLIGALILRPKLLILDEPFNGLDPESTRVIKQYFSDYTKAGNSILFSSHVLEVVEKLCDRFIVFNQGEVKAVGNLDHIRSLSFSKSDDLEEIFYELTKKEA
ncbi:ABC transporter ATP-binding protein [Rossellomorea sp. AcN35-11]|nr:ABC transporter ATP-binding protein [Rossellomorea aquimaris]WJV30833.1 ABC transporter ATP-binding protein [Rossellomorea sp. AcN35-11]